MGGGRVDHNEIIGEIYESLLTPERRMNVLDGLREIMGGNNANWFVPNLEEPECSFLGFTGDPDVLQPYLDYYMPMDVWHAHAIRCQPGEILTLNEGFNRTTYGDNEMNNDYLLKWLNAGSICTAVLGHHGDLASHAGVYRPPGAPDFDPNAIATLKALAPHFMRFTQVYQKLEGLNAENLRLSAALDRIASGVVIVDAELNVLTLNIAAEAIFGAEDGFVAIRGKLMAAHPGDHAELARLVGGAAVAGNGSTASGGNLGISRTSLKRSYSILAAPLRDEHTQHGGKRGAAILFITDPELAPLNKGDAIASLYGLTAAESRLALSLLDGKSIKDTAEAYDIGVGTVRFHLKQIFQKTHTSRQGELIALLSKSVSGIMRR